ncbi:Transcription and mRNA export factor ENY2-2 [Larimichthys crocea]|uniref:Uncharacterized protein n=1 Tax=Larimichthys crocea TaxID=215358 RepID=A0ACD3QUH2_LARCR|nr:Transcription and mRNA export factor ENY2-2 [Larimichthys crocea]
MSKESRMRATINQKLTEMGERERLKELLRAKLTECGWKDQMKAHCKEVIKEKGFEHVTVEDLVVEITPKGRVEGVTEQMTEENLHAECDCRHSTPSTAVKTQGLPTLQYLDGLGGLEKDRARRRHVMDAELTLLDNSHSPHRAFAGTVPLLSHISSHNSSGKTSLNLTPRITFE